MRLVVYGCARSSGDYRRWISLWAMFGKYYLNDDRQELYKPGRLNFASVKSTIHIPPFVSLIGMETNCLFVPHLPL